MSVTEYDICFTQLSKYGSHMIPTKRQKIKRFIRGLNDQLFHVMAAQEFSSYSVMVDRARMLEEREVGDSSSLPPKRPKVND